MGECNGDYCVPRYGYCENSSTVRPNDTICEEYQRHNLASKLVKLEAPLKLHSGSITEESETLDILVMILIMKDVQGDQLRHIRALGEGSGTDSEIPCNVLRNHVLCSRFT